MSNTSLEISRFHVTAVLLPCAPAAAAQTTINPAITAISFTLAVARDRPVGALTFTDEGSTTNNMVVRSLLAVVLVAGCLAARADSPFRADPRAVPTTQAPDTAPDPSAAVVYMCPMDPDIRSHKAGTCRRCGMTLVAGLPDPVEFHLEVGLSPPAPAAATPAVLQFSVHDPWRERPVPAFNVVHERLFHAFVVSEDLEYFEHGHPALVADGVFQYPMRFPKPGMYRILSDFYPVGATPQLTTETVIIPGATAGDPVHLTADYSAKTAQNMRIVLDTIPDQPAAGNRTQLRFTIDDVEGLEPYLGAWGHLLAVSEDLIDMMHEHPSRTDGGTQVDFDVVFPREQTYRVWVQFQKKGVVNTARFDVPVRLLR